MITFDYSKDGVRPDTNRDVLTLGLVTTDNDAVLVHISSKNNEDYIEMELVSALRVSNWISVKVKCN